MSSRIISDIYKISQRLAVLSTCIFILSSCCNSTSTSRLTKKPGSMFGLEKISKSISSVSKTSVDLGINYKEELQEFETYSKRCLDSICYRKEKRAHYIHSGLSPPTPLS